MTEGAFERKERSPESRLDEIRRLKRNERWYICQCFFYAPNGNSQAMTV
jgi:hypothetical protein